MRHLFGFPRGTPNGIWLLVPGWCCGEAIGVSFTRKSSLGGEAEIRDFNSITKRPQGPITFRGRESWCMHTGLSWQIKFCGILSVLDELVMMVLSNLRRVTNEDVGTRSIKARSWSVEERNLWDTQSLATVLATWWRARIQIIGVQEANTIVSAHILP